LKATALRRGILGSLLEQDYLEKHFASFSHPGSHRHLQLWSNKAWLVLEPGKTLPSPMRCWFCRYTAFKSYKVMEASTQISRESLGGQARFGRVRNLAGSPLEDNT
jgi:hypothetical protein